MSETVFGSSGFDPALAAEVSERSESTESGLTPDLGDLVVVLLASTLAGLRDRLAGDGFSRASDLVAELANRCDGYLEEVAS